MIEHELYPIIKNDKGDELHFGPTDALNFYYKNGHVGRFRFDQIHKAMELYFLDLEKKNPGCIKSKKIA